MLFLLCKCIWKGETFMKNFIDYIEDSCRGLGGSQSAYRYKKMLLDQMNQRAAAVAKAGLKDENVMRDLIKDEYPDPEKGFKGWEKRNRKVKFMKKGMPIGALVSLLLVFIAYFSVSAMTSAWGKTWLIIVGGIFAMIIFGLSVAASEICRMRRIFHPIARLLIVGNTVLVAVFIFLFLLMMIPEMTVWPILPAGVILALIADLIFAFATNNTKKYYYEQEKNILRHGRCVG